MSNQTGARQRQTHNEKGQGRTITAVTLCPVRTCASRAPTPLHPAGVKCAAVHNNILIILFVTSAAMEIVGILATGKSFIRDVPDHPGVKHIHIPSGWQAVRGPGIIVLGILVGCAGNIVALLN
ncbi:hypothetical protein [Mycolicibacterium hippocampi]|nr:hypothetical protein [Mycolicibacterium hippocampi]